MSTPKLSTVCQVFFDKGTQPNYIINGGETRIKPQSLLFTVIFSKIKERSILQSLNISEHFLTSPFREKARQ